MLAFTILKTSSLFCESEVSDSPLSDTKAENQPAVVPRIAVAYAAATINIAQTVRTAQVRRAKPPVGG